MGSELVPRQPGTVATTGDNSYKAVQEKLGRLAGKMDDAGTELDALRRRIRSNANKADQVGTDIANAGLDRRYIEVMNLLVTALGAAATQALALQKSATEVCDLAHRTRNTHQKLYGGLDEVRSNRNVATPKPGFFDN
ncbi:conjugal transfer protein TraB [Streptomyces sp. NPDC056544]|uniref:conjugal transfer protein TraB n=1 Tax=unclassified Streptomyces TaxID=2593676 RepID=UPI0036A19831